MVTNESSNPASERLFILIGLLNEIETLNDEYPFTKDSCSEFEANADLVMLQSILYDAIETVAQKTNSTPHHVERIFNDVIVNDDMRFNIVYFCKIVIDWLITNNKSALKEVLVKNISEDNHDSDLQAIEDWYKKS